MPRRRTSRQTVQLPGWSTLIILILAGGLVIALEVPWVLILLGIVMVACAGGAGFWWIQRRRHLEQLQAYHQQQLQAAYQEHQWDAYHQHQRISQQQQLLEAQRPRVAQRGFSKKTIGCTWASPAISLRSLSC